MSKVREGLAVLLHTGCCTHEENRVLSQEEWKGSRGLKTRTWQERAGILQPGDERPAGSKRTDCYLEQGHQEIPSSKSETRRASKAIWGAASTYLPKPVTAYSSTGRKGKCSFNLVFIAYAPCLTIKYKIRVPLAQFLGLH